MLVLTRKSEEAVKFGDDITVTVVEIKGNQVRLGIDAPAGIRIYRKELYDKIKSENVRAAVLTIEQFKKIKEVVK